MPLVSAEVLKVATPFVSGTVARVAPPFLNTTLPVGVPDDDETVAVNVTACPRVEGLGEDVNAIVVANPTSQLLAADGMPLATTNNSQGPVGMVSGTSKLVDTGVEPVATAMVLCP